MSESSPPPAIGILSASLSPTSRSRRLAEAAREELAALGVEPDFIDLREHPLPPCDGATAYGDPGVLDVKARIERLDRLLVAAPIYNYDVNAALKNLLELTGQAWRGKLVGFLCAAGGAGSYMAVMTFANSLMLDFRCWIAPRFVYAPPEAFDAAGALDPAVLARVRELCGVIQRVRL